MTDKVGVKYIGPRSFFFDDMYGTELRWEKGQVINLPDSIARKFLRHVDCFEVAQPLAEPKKSAADVDDKLANAEKAKKKRETEQMDIEDIRQSAMLSTDKDALVNMALMHWNQKLDKRQSIEVLRSQIIQNIDRFGIV